MTKAKSVAQRRKSRGRPKLEGIPRQPNGQPARSRARMREAARATVTAARMRQYGLTKEQAGSDLAGFAIGRMAISGAFGKDYRPALDAIQEYVLAVSEYMRLKFPTMPHPKAMDYLAGRGHSLTTEPSTRRVEYVEKRYDHYCGKEGVLTRVDGLSRMAFHNTAFHDQIPSLEAQKGVKVCVDALLGA